MVGQASSLSIKNDGQSRVLRGTSPPNPLPFSRLLLRIPINLLAEAIPSLLLLQL